MVSYNQRTQEEIDLTNFYLDKWDKILYSTHPVDQSKAEAAFINAYHYIGLPTPRIYFITSPSRSQCSILPEYFECFLELKQVLFHKLVEVLKDRPPSYTTSLNLIDNNYLSFSFDNRGIKFEKLCSVLYDGIHEDVDHYPG